MAASRRVPRRDDAALRLPASRRANARPAGASVHGRSRRAGGESGSEMASPSTHVEQLERVLLRRGLGALEADREQLRRTAGARR